MLGVTATSQAQAVVLPGCSGNPHATLDMKTTVAPSQKQAFTHFLSSSFFYQTSL